MRAVSNPFRIQASFEPFKSKFTVLSNFLHSFFTRVSLLGTAVVLLTTRRVLRVYAISGSR